MPADEDGSLRRRLARDILTSIEWGAEGTFTVRLHTHPPGDPCPPEGCGQAEAAHPPGDQPDRAPERGPTYCQGCGAVYYCRATPPAHCPVCAARTPAAAGGAPGDPGRGIIQWHEPAGFTVPLAQASPENLAAAMGERYAAASEPGDGADGMTYDDPPYATGGVITGPDTWAAAAGQTRLARLLAAMCCGDPAETARAFCSSPRRHMVFGRDARMLVYEVAEPVRTGQLVGQHRDGGGVRPWAGGPGAPHGIALMNAAAGSLVVVAVPEDPAYPVPDDAQVIVPLDAASAVSLASALGADDHCPAAAGAAGIPCPCGCGYGTTEPFLAGGAAPDGATLAHAAAYGEDPFVNAAEAARQPGELETLAEAEPLLMAATPGPEYFAWRHVGTGIWVARPGAATADVPSADPAAAVLTTAGDVRQLLHAKGEAAR